MKSDRKSLNESCAFITGRHVVCFAGCRKIRLYTEEKVVLVLCDGETEIEGEKLRLTVFSGAEIRLSGSIKRITFQNDGGK